VAGRQAGRAGKHRGVVMGVPCSVQKGPHPRHECKKTRTATNRATGTGQQTRQNVESQVPEAEVRDKLPTRNPKPLRMRGAANLSTGLQMRLIY